MQVLVNNEAVFENNIREEHYDYYQLGKELFFKKDFEAAGIEFAKSIAINDRNPDAYLFMGYFMTTNGQYDDALVFADKTLALEPGYQAANLMKAQIYLEKSNPDKAKVELHRIINNKQYWYDYTPIYARKMLDDIESLTRVSE